MAISKSKRYLEIDFVRGFLIWCMIALHFSWDLQHVFNLKYSLFSGVGKYFALFGSSSFFVLVGVSSTIQKNLYPNKYNFKATLIRSLKLLSFAVMITLAMSLTYPENNIIFGAIHALGVSTLIIYPFLTQRYLSLIIAILIYIMGTYVANIPVATKWLIPFGFKYYGFSSVDYFPLIPNSAYAFLGVFLGNIFYPRGLQVNILHKIEKYIETTKNLVVRFFVFSGRKTLIIYIIHQPILYGICLAVRCFYFL